MINTLTFVVRELQRHKWRTFMTALSVMIGVMSVAIIDIVGDAGIVKFNNELDSLGISGISVSIDAKSGVEPLSSDDEALIGTIRGVDSVMGVIRANGTASTRGEEQSVAVVGIGENADDTISLELKYGRMITTADIMSYAKVCLIDESLSLQFFDTDNSVGMTVDIGTNKVSDTFEIIGVVPTEGSILRSVADDFLDKSVYLPHSDLGNCYSTIAVTADSTGSSDTVTKEIQRVLGMQKGNIDAINASDMATQRTRINRLLDIIKQLLTVIGATSVVVSSLSIMTIMLLTVKERTYEIGIKKSIGACSISILAEFICESGAIALIGGIEGVILSVILSAVIGGALKMTISIDFAGLLLLILASVLIGCAAGAYPAAKAAALKPVDALGRS